MAKISFYGENFGGTVIQYSAFGDTKVAIVTDKVFIFENGSATVSLVADEGFQIDRAFYEDTWGDGEEFIIDDPITPTFEVSLSYTDLEIIIKTSEVSSSGGGEVGGEVGAGYESITGSNNLYLLENSTLKSFSNESFIVFEGGLNEFNDLSNYVIGVMEFPFVIDPSLLGESVDISLGSKNISTEGISIITDTVILSMGEIEVPYKYNNSFDFLETEIVLHLPFTESILLPVHYVIGYTISIEYIIDLYTGNTTLNIRSSKTERVIYSQRFSIGKKIPFITKRDQTVGTISEVLSLQNGLLSATIEVIRNVPTNLNEFNDTITDQSLLSKATGYIVVNTISLETGATLDEKNSILNILKSGVFINE